MITCSIKNGLIEYCAQCEQYPCQRFEQSPYDFFVSYKHVRRRLQTIREQGPAVVEDELNQRIAILEQLLAEYNDGKRKSLYCLATELMDVEDLAAVIQTAAQGGQEVSLREKALTVTRLLQESAGQRGIELRLRRKQ